MFGIICHLHFSMFSKRKLTCLTISHRHTHTHACNVHGCLFGIPKLVDQGLIHENKVITCVFMCKHTHLHEHVLMHVNFLELVVCVRVAYVLRFPFKSCMCMFIHTSVVTNLYPFVAHCVCLFIHVFACKHMANVFL